MENQKEKEVDIESVLASLTPPSVPGEAFSDDDVDLSKIKNWNKFFVVSALAGLLTEPAFHANEIRLDWLLRLVFANSKGRRKPTSAELSRVLNSSLDRAKVLTLEDPTEDLFCDLIMTSRGNYRIFVGHWESAGPYTQTLLDAFHSLPNAPIKRDVLESVYSLLTLSEEIAERSKVHRFTSSAGQPKGVMPVPSAEVLKRLARRVRFTDMDLKRLGINKNALTPFVLETFHFTYMSNRVAGDSPLEFYPLLVRSNGLVVANPATISLAIRAIIIDAALRRGMDKVLLSAMLREQQKYCEASAFWPVPSLELSPPNQHLMRAAVCRFAPGRFLHIVQVPISFDHFPERAFASVRELSKEVNQTIADDVSKFWEFLKNQSDHRQSISVILLSGWGTPCVISPPIDDIQAPKEWHYLVLTFAEATVLGACDNGRLRDISRILEQVKRLEADGFTFQNVNGLLNLFGFWRNTNGNLVAEHWWQIEPPCNIVIPTDELLGPRIEAAKKRDIRALPFPTGVYKTVQRMDWGDINDLQPVYGSLEDATQDRLLGATYIEERTWWIELPTEANRARERAFRLWHAVLQWLAAVGSRIIDEFPQSFPIGTSRIELRIPADSDFRRPYRPLPDGSDLSATVSCIRKSDSSSTRVQILPDWIDHLNRPQNDAEVELIAAILSQISSQQSSAISRVQLRDSVCRAIGSKDWRWLHVRQVSTPLDRLASNGLTGRFEEIPLSATTLIKCGSIWGMRKRSDGLEISGEDGCRDFLTSYRNHILDELISHVRNFNCEKLLVLAAECYQAARLEHSRWRESIRALRAIDGATANANAFKRQSAINAVQRASKSICEIAACEAPLTGGLDPSRTDLDEMFARVLMLMVNVHLFASIRAGLIEPTLRISPAGDLLGDRLVYQTILKPEAEWTHARTLNEAAEAYWRNRTEKKPEVSGDRLAIDDMLRKAIEAEYSDSAEAFFDLQFALVQIAEKMARGVFLMRRSELSRILASNKQYQSSQPGALLNRLTLSRRPSWRDRSTGLSESDIDVGRFDRPFSIINRPFLAVDDDADPNLLIVPMFVSDSTMYSFSGLRDGSLHNQYWTSQEAKMYAGDRAHAAGTEFEQSVAKRLRALKLKAWPRCKLSWALNQKVDDRLGDIDVLAISPDSKRVWVIEVKNLRLCRTEAEVASRLSEYRGRRIRDSKGRDKPDKMLRHIRRVKYLRQRNSALIGRLELDKPPEVRGLLIVDAPQPMNFYMIEQLADGQSAFLDAIDSFKF